MCTCGRGAGGTAHVEAVVWVCVEAVGLCRLMASTDGLVHSVAVAKMETALKVATVICAHIPIQVKTTELKCHLNVAFSYTFKT